MQLNIQWYLYAFSQSPIDLIGGCWWVNIERVKICFDIIIAPIFIFIRTSIFYTITIIITVVVIIIIIFTATVKTIITTIIILTTTVTIIIIIITHVGVIVVIITGYEEQL